jgi:hypothetical protein
MRELREVLKTKDRMLDDKNEEMDELKKVIGEKDDEIDRMGENKNTFRDSLEDKLREA